MADTPDVAEPEITPEDFAADEVQDSPKADPSPAKEEAKAEPEKPEVAKGEEKEAKGDDTPADKEAPPEPPSKEGEEEKPEDGKPNAEKPEGEDKPLGDEPLKPKSENRFQQLANDNKALRKQIEDMTAQVYAPQTAEELTDIVNPETGEQYTRSEAAVLALEQRLQMKEFNEKVTSAHTVLGAESYEILQEMPMFNPESDQFDAELADIAADTLEANLIRDPNIPELDAKGKPTGRGVVVDYHRSPKQIYSKLAKIHAASETKGQLKGQQSAQTMAANADTPSSAAPPVKPKDPLAEIWETPLV